MVFWNSRRMKETAQASSTVVEPVAMAEARLRRSQASDSPISGLGGGVESAAIPMPGRQSITEDFDIREKKYQNMKYYGSAGSSAPVAADAGNRTGPAHRGRASGRGVARGAGFWWNDTGTGGIVE